MGGDFEGFECGPLLPLVLHREHPSYEVEVSWKGLSGLFPVAMNNYPASFDNKAMFLKNLI